MSDAPLYLQVRETLISRMASGALKPGTALPSEFALAGELGVSQGTVRKALDTLAADNLVLRRQGRGTFVPEATTERALFSFFRLTGENGESLIPEPVTEEIRHRPAPARIAERLGLEKGAIMIRIRRTRALMGRVAALEDIFLDPALLPIGEEDGPLPNALYTHYQRAHGLSVTRAEDFMQAVGAPAKAAKALGLAEGAPLLLARRDAFDITDRVVETRESWFLTEGLGYGVTLR
ncbi:GntR family transcriptional regulator [Pontivivens ytuae]|uniref:GntR family transcriptional regulator n=1 Tax=Pontivivens ytuae TaxID=2789856 RepID=A0A7S9QC71_9RHOB|nr:GntR family transcriptional regulator [Pontivivens ytuae]QPH53510.1 GntR family transcriptional regulator [Pontivivens ytuae]